MEDNQKWGKRNSALVELGGYFAIVAVILAIIIGLIVYGIHLSSEKYSVDEASGARVIKDDLGAITNWELPLVGFDKISEKYPQNAYMTMIETLRKYLSIVQPNAEKISYVKDSYKDGNFQVQVGGSKYTISARAQSSSAIDFEIKDSNGPIFSYSSSSYNLEKKSANSIDSFLPYVGKTENGDSYRVYRRKKDQKLEIAISSCGKNEAKTHAKEAVNKWLESNNFNPDDFKFEIPDYCDGES